MEALEWSVVSRSGSRTQDMARRIGEALLAEPAADRRNVVALTGDLGAGKTTFVQGLAQGLGVSPDVAVVSPTYALMNEYPGDGLSLIHIDFYRLEACDEVRALGLEEQIARRDAVVAVEWADKLPQLLPERAVWIDLRWVDTEQRRLAVRGLPKPEGLLK